MRRISKVVTGLPFALALFALEALAAPLNAQERGSLFGTIFDQQTLEPISGATITLTEGQRAIRSADDGSFVFSDLPAGTVTLRISVPGFATAVEGIEIDPGELSFVQFSVLPLGATLREVLALAGASGAASGSSVSEVYSDSVHAATTAADLLERSVPGLAISRGGSVGSGSSLRIRGVSSLTLASTPAIYLDGVRIDAQSSVHLPLRNSPTLFVLDAIPAADVKRIRVLRGSSAPARFGDSANGVILIETRTRSEQ